MIRAMPRPSQSLAIDSVYLIFISVGLLVQRERGGVTLHHQGAADSWQDRGEAGRSGFEYRARVR